MHAFFYWGRGEMQRVQPHDFTTRTGALMRRLLGAVVFALLFLSAPYASAAKTPVTSSVFDHSKTGFPLTGAHNNAKCEGCHQRGILKGTPKTCSGCHAGGSGFPEATAASASHIPTTAGCDSCHRTNA